MDYPKRSRSRRGSKGSQGVVESSSELSLESAGEVIGAAAEHSPSLELPRHSSAANESRLSEGAALWQDIWEQNNPGRRW